MKKQNVNTVSLVYKRLPVEALPPCAGWIVFCMSGNAAFSKPPIPYVPPVPPDPATPLDMTTRVTNLQTAITNYEDGGSQALNARNIAQAAVTEGLDALAFYVQTVARFNLPLLLASGFQARSNNRAQTKLDTPAITGIDNDSPTTLDVHVTSVANAIGYEVQTCIGTADWKTVMFSPQARTITLTGLTTGTVYNVRVRALGGSTGQSDWSMPGSSIVD
jgi:hypothetical protein